MSRKLGLRTEYGAWPIWDIDDFGYVDPNKLPLKQETIDRLLEWQATLDATLNQDYPPNSHFPNEEAKTAWRLEGISLWQQVQQELEPDYEVYYYLYCNNKKHFLRHPDELKQFAL
jgi:hypothetical protein